MKIHKYATIILYNEERKVLMQHRAEDDDQFPGYWGFFGGGLEESETPEEGLRRELLEEIEYKTTNPKLFSTEEFLYGSNETAIGYTFIEEYDNSQPIVLHEGQGYGWFTVPEALNLKITDLRRECLLKFKDYLDKPPTPY